MKAYTKTPQQLAQELNTDLERGLTHKEAENRLKEYGPNSLPEHVGDSWFVIFVRQFKSPLIYVLCLAAIIVFVFGKEKFDAFLIAGILMFNAIISALQEGRAQNILESLKKLSKTTSIVIRDGHEELIDDVFLVPGDIIIIQDGSKVPADVRVIQAHSLYANESMLTGESESILKTAHELEQDSVPIYEQKNMLFKGSYVTAGTGKALVITTGTKTELGSIQETIQAVETEMPLKKEIDRISYLVLFIVAGVCLVFFIIGLINGMPLHDLFITLVALFVSAVPEGLPIVLTVALAVGAYRLAQRNVLIKRMQAVEGLGRAHIIIIDKTGTLTRNELMVSKVFCRSGLFNVTGSGYFQEGDLIKNEHLVDPRQHEDVSVILTACALLSHAQLKYDKGSKTFEVKGDPTNAALSVFGKKLGFDRDELDTEYHRVYEIPFDSEWQYHAVFVEHNGKGFVYIIGSPEVLCAQSVKTDMCQAQDVNMMLEQGLRILAVAVKPFEHSLFGGPEKEYMKKAAAYLESGLEVVGILGLNDAIRSDVAESIASAQNGGLRVIMATGDHKKTAVFVADNVGIAHEKHQVVTGVELDALNDEQLYKKVQEVALYARVIPTQKMRIVAALQKQGNLVAMTGDGVNDAPALVAADLGIAMGAIGTEVAKQAADIVLLDDSFTSIVEAIKYGRHIFYTLRRVVLYFFATNFGELLIILSATSMNMPLPLTAVQLLWLNMVTDGFLDIGLALEPKERGLLRDRWFLGKPRIIDFDFLAKMLFMAVPMTVFSVYVFYYTYSSDLLYARSLTLLVMAMFQWFNAWNCRSEKKSVFRLGIFTNKWLVLATAIVISLQLALYYIPFMRQLFNVAPLSLYDWFIALVLSSTIFWLEEGRKFFVARFWKKMD